VDFYTRVLGMTWRHSLAAGSAAVQRQKINLTNAARVRTEGTSAGAGALDLCFMPTAARRVIAHLRECNCRSSKAVERTGATHKLRSFMSRSRPEPDRDLGDGCVSKRAISKEEEQ